MCFLAEKPQTLEEMGAERKAVVSRVFLVGEVESTSRPSSSLAEVRRQVSAS